MAFAGTIAGTSVAGEDEYRVGTIRNTMKTNALLSRAELGKAKKTIFAPNDPEHVFGYTPEKDPEGAREVTGIWKEHQRSPGKNVDAYGKPKADFKTMNKLAAMSGVTTAKEVPAFRADNKVFVKKSEHTLSNSAGPFPSDKNPKHTYGMPSGYRTADVIRNNGPDEPPMKHVVQGAYQHDWVDQNAHKVESEGAKTYIPPVPTRAAVGHAIGAQKYLQPEHREEEWKMTKFKTVPSKLTGYISSGTAFKGSESPKQAPPAQQAEEYPAPVSPTA